MPGLSSEMEIEFGSHRKAQSPVTYLAAITSALPETAGEGFVAATLSIVGDAYVAPASFIITSDPSGFFEIVGDELRVKSGAVFDYETASSYPVNIEGTDAVPNTYSKTIFVQISNVNEAPTALALSANNVDENAPGGSVVGVWSTTDPDAGGTFSYTMLADASGFFEIVGDELRVKNGAALDYETAASHDITVQTSDGALTFSGSFTINVNDVNEAPTDISLSTTDAIDGSAIGTVIAVISSSDPDIGAGATYTKIADPDNRFSIVGNELRVNGAMVEGADHDVTIRVSDGSLTYNEPFTIDVIAATITRVSILVGQSQMVGHATFDSGAVYPVGTLQYTQSGLFEATPVALDFVSGNSGTMGISLQAAIDEKATKPNIISILVPCAINASGFSNNEWNKGDPSYELAVARANAVMAFYPDAELAIYWHQGETDEGIAATYAATLDQMISDMRADITAADATTPFILGGLSPDFIGVDADRISVNDQISDTPNRVGYTAVSYSGDLDTFDNLHFDAPSTRLLGSRYFLNLGSATVDGDSVYPAPDVPTNLAASAGDSTVTLTWDAPVLTGGPITDYIVERQVSGGGFSVITDGVTPSTGYVDNTVTNDLLYGYRVFAVNASEQSAASNVDSDTPAAVSSAFFDDFSSDTSVNYEEHKDATFDWDSANNQLDVIAGSETYSGVITPDITVVDSQNYQFTINAGNDAGAQVDCYVGTTAGAFDLGVLPSGQRLSSLITDDMIMSFTASGTSMFITIRKRGAAIGQAFGINSILVEAV